MLTFDAVQSHTTMDMAILLEAQLSENQGLTPEGYLICKNVPVSRTGVQYYYGQELGLDDKHNRRIPVYRLAEDVFEQASLESLESKPITDDHPQQSVTVQNAGFLSMGHGRNARHNDRNVLADLVVMNAGLIEGIRAKRKYEISLGYTCNYIPYKDGFRQTNIRVNHIAVVESGRAGKSVSIKDKAPVPAKNRRKTKMDKNTALATMFAAFAKDATPEELTEMLPFVTDAAPIAAPAKPEAEKSDKGLIALLTGLIAKDSKPAVPAPAETVTLDAVGKLIDEKLAKLALATKPKATKDSDEKEIEKMLEDSDEDEDKSKTEDEDPDKEKETEDDAEESEEQKEAKDAAFAGIVKALQPLYKNLPAKDQKIVRDQLVKARKKPTADTYSAILDAVKKHSKDAAPVQTKDAQSVSDRVMAKRNPAYMKQA